MIRCPWVGATLLFAVAACHGHSSASDVGPDGGHPSAGDFALRGVTDQWVSGCWTAGPVRCDPRSNAGCDTAAGQVCEIGQNASKAYTLECFPPPNTQKLGEACSRKSGPYCGPTLHCALDGTCRHFCCSDADCTGRDSQCIALPGGTFGTIGVCAKGPFDAAADGS
jgi:hypothetical protein